MKDLFNTEKAGCKAYPQGIKIVTNKNWSKWHNPKKMHTIVGLGIIPAHTYGYNPCSNIQVSPSNHIPIQRPIVDGFGDVGGFYFVDPLDIRYSTGYLKYTVISPGAHPERINGMLQEGLGFIGDIAEFLYFLLAHLAVRENPPLLKPLNLQFASFINTPADRR